MKNNLRNVYRAFRDLFMIMIKYILKLIPKNNNLILANAWFGEKYADNTMYMYEYLLKNTKYDVIWTTKNKKVYKYLRNDNKPVVLSNSIKGIWTQIRAKLLLSTIQESDFNTYFLCNCILLDLDHGIIYKQVGFDINPNEYLVKHDKVVKKFVDYYMTTPSYLTRLMMEHSYHTTPENTILCGKARLDYFFDKSLRKKSEVLSKVIGNKKTIVYMPTHRSCGQVHLHLNSILDLNYINNICKENGYVFIVKKHFYHRHEEEDFSLYSNIVDLTDEDIDAQELLINADVLVSDYSSCYIDYLLLNRPLVLYTFDLEEYLKNERSLFISYEQLDIGYHPQSKDELNEVLKEIIISDIDRYKENRDKAKSIYFDSSLNIGQSRKEISSIISKLMSGKYRTDWKAIEKKELKKDGVKEIATQIKNM